MTGARAFVLFPKEIAKKNLGRNTEEMAEKVGRKFSKNWAADIVERPACRAVRRSSVHGGAGRLTEVSGGLARKPGRRLLQVVY